MNYLGLDYGREHLGVAIASGPLAEPLTTLTTSSAPAALADLIGKYHVKELVVGDCPSDFLALLKSFRLPVHQIDETLSSHDARANLFHTTRTRRRAKEHSAAAALILQSYLDALPKTG